MRNYESHEDFMKRKFREEEERAADRKWEEHKQLQETIAQTNKNKYIYESPDKGQTVYGRKFGDHTSKRVLVSSPEEQKIYDYLDVKIPIQKSSNKPFTVKIDYDGKALQSKKINYKYNEDALIKEFKEYIDSTYDQHYSRDKFQATEFIMDGGHGTGFCIGNVLKYAQRYGKKGTREDARKDLMKVLHYALMQLYVHDNER